MSALNRAIASAVVAVGCGPLATAASTTSQLHSGPQSTLIPLRQLLRVDVNGCASAKSWGCIKDVGLPLVVMELLLVLWVMSKLGLGGGLRAGTEPGGGPSRRSLVAAAGAGAAAILTGGPALGCDRWVACLVGPGVRPDLGNAANVGGIPRAGVLRGDANRATSGRMCVVRSKSTCNCRKIGRC
jgi:hypothetical protein